MNFDALARRLLTARERSIALNALGAALTRRYERVGDLIDLEDAISAFEQAGADVVSPKWAINLGGALAHRYRRLHAVADLDRAIAVLSALRREEVDDRAFTQARHNLAMALRDRYGVSGRTEDIDAAVLAAEEAVLSASKADNEYTLYLDFLGTALKERFEHLHTVDDLDRCITIHSEALELAASAGLPLTGFKCNLANALVDRFGLNADPRDVLGATDLYRRATREGLERSPEFGLNAAHGWMNLAYSRRKADEVVEAYECAEPMLEQLQRMQVLRSHKESWLRGSHSYSVLTAAALLELGREKQAVVVLETGRARLLSEVLERERPAFDRLAGLGREDLVSRYRRAAAQLKNEIAKEDVTLPRLTARP